MTLETVRDPAFHLLKGQIERFERKHGYYLIDLVSIRPLRDQGLAEETVLDSAFEHFDDQPWPERVSSAGESWIDYEVDEGEGATIAIDALAGGRNLGHSAETVPCVQANVFWCRFRELFTAPRRYYSRMGFGNSDYPFQHGTAIVTSDRAGLLWIVESD